MSVAELEPEVAEDIPSVPEARMGDTVYWYVDGNIRPGNEQPGTVVRVHVNNMVDIVTHSWTEITARRLSVPHVSDVRLKNNAEIRKLGAWEFSPQTLEQHALHGKVAIWANATALMEENMDLCLPRIEKIDATLLKSSEAMADRMKRLEEKKADSALEARVKELEKLIAAMWK
jgi:hypothetical protein